MEPWNAPPASPSPFDVARERVGVLSTGALLAAAGGFLDGFTYVGHGHVFANAMTGNVVLLGIGYFSGSSESPFRHLPPIAAFLLGIWASLALQLRAKRQHAAPPYLGVLLAETAILFVLSLLPESTNNLLITTIVAFTSSVQVSTFREVNGRKYSSTFTTGNLRTLSEAAFAWAFEGHKQDAAPAIRDFSAICTAFLVGATAGGYLTRAFGNRGLWCDLVLLLFVSILVQHHARQDAMRVQSPI